MKRLVVAALFSSSMIWQAQAQRLVPPAEIPLQTTQVQTQDNYRVVELEETVRQLNGKVEELNFLLLQLQEKVRKMEEENEGRFQELEDKQSSIADPSKQVAVLDKAEAKTGDSGLEKPNASVVNTTDANSNTETPIVVGPEPRALGTLTFDADGNVVDETGNTQPVVKNPFGNPSAGALEASQFGATPNEVFKVAKVSLHERQFPKAQQAFSAFLAAWPKDPKVGEARYFLGEALFWQKSYFQSAEMHLETHNEYPEADTAADNLLGLGLSLAGLNQREVACTTYAEVLKQYPDATARLGERIKDEQAAAKC